MKKIYFLGSMVLFSGMILAQKKTTVDHPIKIKNHTNQTKKLNQKSLVKKAPDDILWYEDFANGLSGNLVDGGGTPIAGAWTTGFTGNGDGTAMIVEDLDNSGPTGQYIDGIGGMSSESADNGVILFDANKYTDGTGGDYTSDDAFVESPEFDASGYPNALGVEFQQSFITCCLAEYPLAAFGGFYDGTGYSWTLYDVGNAEVGTNEFSADPDVRLINLSTVMSDMNTAVAANKIDGAGLTSLTGGSLYGDGTYTNVALTGGSGMGAEATIVVSSGTVTSVTLTNSGSGYTTNDILSATDADLGNLTTGSGFSITASQLLTSKLIKIRFHYNPGGQLANVGYYFWSIDDIRLKELYLNDGRLSNAVVGDPWYDYTPYRIPQSQKRDMVLGASVANDGGADLTNISLKIDIIEDASGNSVHSGNTTAFSLTPGQDTTFSEDAVAIDDGNGAPTIGAGQSSAVYYNSGVDTYNNGLHNVEITIQNDDNTTNDTVVGHFEMTDFTYDHYNENSSASRFILRVNDTDDNGNFVNGELLNAYTFFASDIIYGATYVLSSSDDQNFNTTVGQFIEFNIYQSDLADITSLTLVSSQAQEVLDDMIDTELTVKFDTPVEVSAGQRVLIGIKSFGAGSIVTIPVIDGDDDFSGWRIEGDGNMTNSGFDHYLGLSMNPDLPDNPVSTAELSNGAYTLSNSPNPATNNTTINYSIANANNIIIEVVDITGKVITTINEGARAAGHYSVELNTANLTNGVYFYTLTAGQNKLTNKMVITK